MRLFFFPPLRCRTPRSYDIGAAVGWFVHNPFVVGDTTFYARAWSASSPTDPGSIRILYLAVSEGFPGAGPRISISRRFLGRVEDTMSAFSTTTYSRPPCATKKCRTASGWRFRATRKNVNGSLRRSPLPPAPGPGRRSTHRGAYSRARPRRQGRTATSGSRYHTLDPGRRRTLRASSHATPKFLRNCSAISPSSTWENPGKSETAPYPP